MAFQLDIFNIYCFKKKSRVWSKMNLMEAKPQGTYIAFLRGINVGGHHKLPMSELKKEMKHLGFEKIVTILNSGNLIFTATKTNIQKLEDKISKQLESTSGFSVPVIIRSAESIIELYNTEPFKDEKITKDIRLYISFLKEKKSPELNIPWISEDGAYKIVSISNTAILSVLDLSISRTTKAMNVLEKLAGKDITTRNWNTIERIIQKLAADHQ